MSNDLMPVFEQNLASMVLTSEERVLVAVSGGPDSMALLHLFLRWDAKRVGVFHLNHGFREEAQLDADFVEKYAREHELPAHIMSYDILRYLRESGESKQQGARTIRYQLLKECAHKHGYARIALAHHGDDQAETMLMRMLRGSGLHGLGGIPARRGLLIRPLLNVFKDEILRYCQDFQIPYVEDATNYQPIYLRNKVRQELLPLLVREYNPQITTQLVQLAQLAHEDDLELEGQVQRLCAEHVRYRGAQVVFPRSVFIGLSVAFQRRVLRRLLQLYQGHLLRVGFIHIEEWRQQILENTTFRLSLPQVEVSATQEEIYVGFFRGEAWSDQELNVPGQVQAGEFTITAELFSIQDLPCRGGNSEDFDYDDLVFPLIVRPRKPGDRLHPFGGAGSKKVKDLFMDLHIPVEERDYLPMICDQQGILWIPSTRRSNLGPLTEQTQLVVRLSYCHTHALML